MIVVFVFKPDSELSPNQEIIFKFHSLKQTVMEASRCLGAYKGATSLRARQFFRVLYPHQRISFCNGFVKTACSYSLRFRSRCFCCKFFCVMKSSFTTLTVSSSFLLVMVLTANVPGISIILSSSALLLRILDGWPRLPRATLLSSVYAFTIARSSALFNNLPLSPAETTTSSRPPPIMLQIAS